MLRTAQHDGGGFGQRGGRQLEVPRPRAAAFRSGQQHVPDAEPSGYANEASSRLSTSDEPRFSPPKPQPASAGFVVVARGFSPERSTPPRRAQSWKDFRDSAPISIEGVAGTHASFNRDNGARLRRSAEQRGNAGRCGGRDDPSRRFRHAADVYLTARRQDEIRPERGRCVRRPWIRNDR